MKTESVYEESTAKGPAVRLFVWITIISFVVAYLLIFKGDGVFQSDAFISLVHPIGVAVTIDSILLIIFIKYVWKLKIFRGWLVNYPNLNGSWKGTYKTDSGKQGNVELAITQSLTHIDIAKHTDNGVSQSYSVEILYNPSERKIKKLVFSYNYSLRKNVENVDHRGTYDLFIDEKGNTMNGLYWTSKGTHGDVRELKRS